MTPASFVSSPRVPSNLLLSLPFIVLLHMTLMAIGSVAENSIVPWVSKFSTSAPRFRTSIVAAPATLVTLKSIAAAAIRASSAFFMWLLLSSVDKSVAGCKQHMPAPTKVAVGRVRPPFSAAARRARRSSPSSSSATAACQRHYKTVYGICQALGQPARRRLQAPRSACSAAGLTPPNSHDDQPDPVPRQGMSQAGFGGVLVSRMLSWREGILPSYGTSEEVSRRVGPAWCAPRVGERQAGRACCCGSRHAGGDVAPAGPSGRGRYGRSPGAALEL